MLQALHHPVKQKIGCFMPSCCCQRYFYFSGKNKLSDERANNFLMCIEVREPSPGYINMQWLECVNAKQTPVVELQVVCRFYLQLMQ